MRYSKAWKEPSGASGIRTANRRPGLRAFTTGLSGSISIGMNHPASPGPVAIASHTASGVASSGTSLRISNGFPM